MPQRFWLIHANGGRQLIDPEVFDLEQLAASARSLGGRLVVEETAATAPRPERPRFEPPPTALGPIFRARQVRILVCRSAYTLDVNARATQRVLGGYYHRRRLIRVYTHDRQTGRRPTEELFDTFLHELAHHLEYTEPDTFQARDCGRVPGRMHSRLFWRILGELKGRWARLQSGKADFTTEDTEDTEKRREIPKSEE